MGVNYKSKFGVGFRIKCPINEEDESTFVKTDTGIMRDMYDFAKHVRQTSDYLICDIGDYDTDEEVEWYIFTKNPFSHGTDLANKERELAEYCDKMGIKIIGKLNLYGGQCIS